MMGLIGDAGLCTGSVLNPHLIPIPLSEVGQTIDRCIALLIAARTYKYEHLTSGPCTRLSPHLTSLLPCGLGSTIVEKLGP